MKNVKLLCLGLLMAGSASAQYFQHVYGSQRRDYLESGVNNIGPVTQFPQGHIMCGYSDLNGSNQLMVTRTDLNGNIPVSPNTFNNSYRIVDPNIAQVLDVKGRRVVQFTSQRIGVWGDYGIGAGSVSTNFFYTLLGPNGVPGPIMSYTLPYPVAQVEATSMCIPISSSTSNFVFVCGWEQINAGGPRDPIVMCLNSATGNIVWSAVYNIANVTVPVDWAAMDLVESPYPNASGTVDIAVTGHFVQPFVPVLSGFFMLVDAFNGTPGNVITYGTTTDNGAFNAIDVANNPFGSGNGFVMGGFFFNRQMGNNDAWAMKVDPTGTIVNFSQLHDYSHSDNNYANDIIERWSAAHNAYEYYLGGYVNNGVFGQNDDVVFKLNASGGAVGQFTYGGPGNEQVMQLDKYDSIGLDSNGLSVYGNTDGGSWPLLGGPDFYFVKAYFNGVTACNWDTTWHDSIPGPGVVEYWRPYVPNKLKQGRLIIGYSPMQDWEICFTQMDPGGSNARMAQTAEQQLLEPGYFPNPVSLDNPVINVTFGNVVKQGEAEIELWNAVGQLMWTKKASLTDGQTQLQVDLGDQLSGGMYHLVVRQNGTINNYRIVVK